MCCHTKGFDSFWGAVPVGCGVQPGSLSLGCQLGGHGTPETQSSLLLDAVALQTLLLYNKE